MCFIALSFFFYVPNVARFDAGMLKLQQMIKWDVFLGHGVYCLLVYIVCFPTYFFPFTYLFPYLSFPLRIAALFPGQMS